MGEVTAWGVLESIQKMLALYIIERGLRTDTFDGASPSEVLIIVVHNKCAEYFAFATAISEEPI